MSEVEPTCSGAVAPERSRTLSVGPVQLRLHEWGDPESDPFVLCHGMWDHARGFDQLAPLLAERYRVIGIDARGHGDSSWTDAYRWPDDVLDICSVLRSLERPCHLLGHSRGGGQATDAACVVPERVRALINIDGFGPSAKDFEPRPGEPTELTEQMAQFLDRIPERPHRPATSLDELVARRARTNTRLSPEWLRYFTFHATRRDAEHWKWKSDPRIGQGFGPWKPEWIAPVWAHVHAPMLAICGTEPDFYGPASDAQLDERLANVKDVSRVRVAGTGHFVHMEAPQQTARLVLDFVASR
jgi:pimeloyl-ACP methyl ester carboxylesterase